MLVVDAGAGTDAEGGGGAALDVEVDEEDAVAAAGEAGGEVDRGGGLADAALLVRDADDGHAIDAKRHDREGQINSL